MRPLSIIPTVVPGSCEAAEDSAARWRGVAPVLHIDATDGDFASPATWAPSLQEKLPEGIVWEAHLMVRDSLAWGERFIRAGARRIIVHMEAMSLPLAAPLLEAWRAAGASEVGIALKLDTPFSLAAPLAPRIDVVHLMTIQTIGAQGQSFEPRSIDRIAEARSLFPRAVISVDGGINENNIQGVVRAGASRMCVGSALSSAADAQATYARLSKLAEDALQ